MWIVGSTRFVDNVLVVRRPHSDVLGTNIFRKFVDGATFHAAVLSTVHTYTSTYLLVRMLVDSELCQ